MEVRRRFGWTVSFAAIVTVLGLASSSPASGAEPTSGVRVRVYNYARAEHKTLAEAESEAAWILSHAGIATVWLDCPLTPAEFEDHPACRQPLGPADIFLRIIPGSVEGELPFNRSKVGFAFLTKDGPRGSLAGVFYQRLFVLARGDDHALALGLGRAVAHEIGHLLLRSEGHSRWGIMRDNWSGRDFRGGTAILLFTPDQSARMRVEVEERQADDQASLYVAASPSFELAAK